MTQETSTGGKLSFQEIFRKLNALDITPYLKTKQNMKYLPWSQCYTILSTHFDNWNYDPIKNPEGLLYFNDGKTCWVETSITIEGITRSEHLAVMDHRNTAVSVEDVRMTDVQKSIKRCFVKNAALFGLGLSLWVNEDYSELGRQAKEAKDKEETALKILRKQIVEICTEKKNLGIPPKEMYAIIAKYANGQQNPNKIADVESCEKAIEELKTLEIL